MPLANNDLLEALSRELKKDIVGETAEETPKEAKPLLELFGDVAKADKNTTIEFAVITGEPHEDGNLHHWPKSIVHKDTDWAECMRVYIPENHDRHVPEHSYVCDLLDALAYNKVLLAKGSPGSGKDSTIEWLCGKLRIPYIREDGAEGKEPSDILGYCVPNGDGGYTESEGLLTQFVRNGGVYVDSEPFVNSAAVNMCKQSLFEGCRILKFIGHPEPAKAQIQAHEDFRILLTSNTRGTGDDIGMYAATTVQDSSTLNRVDIHTEVHYLSAQKEIAMLEKNIEGITYAFAAKMVQLAALLRNAWSKGDASLSLPFSPRQLTTWGEKAVRMGEPVQGFKQCYYNALDEVEKGFVQQLWRDVDFGVEL